jgi:hypothetical protein
LQAIIDDFWSVEYIENAFWNAERKTGVEIAIVTLTKKTEGSFSFQDFETEQEYFWEINETALASPDRVGNIVADYKRSVELYAEWVAMIRKADKIAKQFWNHANWFEIATKAHSTNNAAHDYADNLRQRVWNSIFSAMNIDKYMTWKVLEAFRAKMAEQGNIAINKQNIEAFLSVIMQNSWNILEESITDSFKHLTKYHKENRYDPEWWAHNETYMVWKKFVLPYIMKLSAWGWFSKLYRHWKVSELEDLDKALCYLTGTRHEDCKCIVDSINEAIEAKVTKCQSEFFDIVFYKKWTVHFTFRSPKVWADFNIRATKSLGWLPQDMEWKWRQKNKF